MGSFAQGAMIEQITSTATSASTTTLTVSSTTFQRFTGTAAETVVLPDATTLKDGRYFIIDNRSTGVLTIQANGGSELAQIASGTERIIRLYDNAVAAGDWVVTNQVDLDGPLAVHATRPTADGILNVEPNQVEASDGTQRSTTPVDDVINTYTGATINFQTGSATGGTSGGLLTTNGSGFTRPTVTSGQFTRMVMVYQSTLNTVDTSFSAAAATQGALENPGTLFAALEGTPIAYVDLESEGSFNFKTAGAATGIIENSQIYQFGSGAGGGGAGGDESFKLQSISTNVATIKKGFIILDDGKELVTYNGVSSNVDLSVNLKTEVNTFGVTSPSASTTYYLYLDLAFLPASTITTGDANRIAYGVQKGTSGMFTVLASTPENTDLSRYVPISVIETDGSSDYVDKDDLARRRHQVPSVNVSPLVGTILDGASIGTVGAVANAQQELSASDFPAGTATFYHLNSDSNDDSTNGINLTQNGTVTFLNKGFFGRENVCGINGTASTFLSSTNAQFNPGDADFALGGWFLSTDADPVSAHIFSQDFGGDRGFRALIPSSGTLRFQSHTAALAEVNLDVEFTIEAYAWNHFVFVHDSVANEMRVIINGSLIGTTALADNRSVSSPDIHIGSAGTGADNWPGFIQDFFFVNGDALTEAEVNSIYSRRFKNNAQLAGGHILTNESFPCTSLTDKISYYNLTDLTDGSGNAHTLTNLASVTFGGTNIFGTTSSIAEFDGTNTLTSTDTFFNTVGGTTWAIGGWFAAEDWSDAGTLISVRENAPNLGPRIETFSSEFYFSWSEDGSALTIIRIPTAGLVDGTWHHLLMVYDGVQVNVYVDGVSAGSQASTGQADTTAPFAIGSRYAGGSPGGYYTGRAQEVVFIRDVVMTGEDVFKLFSSRIDLAGTSASVRKEDQIWHVNGRREDGQTEYKLNDQFLLDNSRSGKIYVNFAGEPGDCVDLKLHDGGLGASTVPVRKFDRTYTATPPATIAHNLPDMPTNFAVLHDDLATGQFIPLNPESYLKADATNIYTSGFGLLTIDATHPLRIIGSVGVPAIGTSSGSSSGGFDVIVVDSATTTTYTTTHGQEVLVDSDTAATTINLPATPNVGDRVRARDGSGSALTNNITVGRNGSLIEGVASDHVINLNRTGVDFVYMNAAQGWIMFDL